MITGTLVTSLPSSSLINGMSAGDIDSWEFVESPVVDENDVSDVERQSCPPTPSSDTAVDMDESDNDEVFRFPLAVTGADATKAGLYGGLVNLGNTCYLASALNLLASLDSFAQRIYDEEPSDANKSIGSDELLISLRQHYLALMARLSRGETVHPEDFKSAVDERTPLFAGYRQQDAHEFLTSLLDMLDAECRTSRLSAKAEEIAGVELASEIVDEKPQAMLFDDAMDISDDADHSRLVSTKGDLRLPCSFSSLSIDEIGHLLHGTSSTAVVSSPLLSSFEPCCKLAGGRMNTTDIIMAPSFGEADATVCLDSPSASSGAPVKESRLENGYTVPDVESPVHSCFTTTARVCLVCDSCKYTRTHNETYFHLSLELGPDSGSVEDGLRKFFAPEKRDIKCEKCFGETAMQTVEITRLPPVLLLHFKRFIVNYNDDYSSVNYRKNSSPVTFHDHLTFGDEAGLLSEFLATDFEWGDDDSKSSLSQGKIYKIRSVINHIGSSVNCGHYTTDAHRLLGGGVGQQRQWMRFNDAHVSRISSHDAIEGSARTAYLIAYEME